MASPTPIQLRKLERLARKAAGRAYAPYSQFHVGAAVLTSSGGMFTGCNVENASFGLCQCAERAAISHAVVAGKRSLQLQCIVLYTATRTATTPCGACRQVIHEFGPDARVISICDSKDRIDVSLGVLLPGAFGPADLR